MNKMFNGDPIIEDLRKRYPKRGPDPKPNESMEQWAERYMKYADIMHRKREFQEQLKAHEQSIAKKILRNQKALTP